MRKVSRGSRRPSKLKGVSPKRLEGIASGLYMDEPVAFRREIKAFNTAAEKIRTGKKLSKYQVKLVRHVKKYGGY